MLDTNDSLKIKGIAIILMFLLHFLGYPEFYCSGIVYLWCGTPNFIQNRVGQLCVGLFVFLNGYSFAKKMRFEHLTYKYNIYRCFKLLISYYIVIFFIVYPIGFFLSEPFPSLNQFLPNLFGFYTDPSWANGGGNTYLKCTFAWFIYLYCSLMLLSFPRLVKKYCKLNPVIKIMIVVFLPRLILYFAQHVLTKNTIPYLLLYNLGKWGGIYLVGIIFPFSKVEQYFLSKNQYVNIIIVTIMFIFRCAQKELYGFNLDILYVPVICVLSKNIRLIKNDIIEKLEKQSMNMWLCSSIYFMPSLFLQNILLRPRLSIIIFLLSLLTIFPCAYLCSYLDKLIFKVCDNLLKK